MGSQLEERRVNRRQLERLTLDGEALLAGHAIWLGGNPAPELADVRRKITAAEARIDPLRADSPRHAPRVIDRRIASALEAMR